MARFFVFLVVVGSTTLVLYQTRPTQVDYLAELDGRWEAVTSFNQEEERAFSLMDVGNPLDAMVTTASPAQLIKRTRFDDFVVFSIFTTEFEAPGYGTRQVRTFGFVSSFLFPKIL